MSRSTSWLLVIVLVAVLARAAFCGLVVGWHHDPIGDEIDFHTIATSLADGEGFRTVGGQVTARRPPLYPLVLAAAYKSVRPSVAWGRILQVLLGGAAVVLTFVVARSHFSPATAWMAAIFVAICPFLVFISGYLLTENLYILLMLASIAVAPTVESTRWHRVLSGGALLGLATLARSTAFGIAVWIAAALVAFGKIPVRARITRAIAIIAVVFALLTPWAARNHASLGEWMWFTSHGGITFYQGNNDRVLDTPQYRGGVAPLYMLPAFEDLRQLPEVEKDAAAWAQGRRFLVENAREIPVLVVRKLGRFWRLKSESGMSGIGSGWWFARESFFGRLAASVDVGFLYAVVVVPLFAAGLYLTRRRHRRLLFLYGIIVVHTVSAAVFFGSLRMRIPIEPVIAMFAAETIQRVALRLRGRQGAGASPLDES